MGFSLKCTHCKENLIYVFLFWELRGLSPNFHIHVSVNVLYIPRIGPHISLQQNRQMILEIYKSLTDILYECRNWETEHYNSVCVNNSFISENTLMGTRHLYWILTGPSFAVQSMLNKKKQTKKSSLRQAHPHLDEGRGGGEEPPHPPGQALPSPGALRRGSHHRGMELPSSSQVKKGCRNMGVRRYVPVSSCIL
jgi:hypothetical protein